MKEKELTADETLSRGQNVKKENISKCPVCDVFRGGNTGHGKNHQQRSNPSLQERTHEDITDW